MQNLEEELKHIHPTETTVALRGPTVDDGAAMWRLARDSKTLDLNSSYAYLLWARDFARTSVIVTVDDEPAGFVTGYVRPDEPTTLMVWQVAVDHAYRGQRLASRMLAHLAGQHPDCTHVETTITSDNTASIALFMSFASAQGAPVDVRTVFPTEAFPDGHDAELVFRIGPLS
jgi:L-2,4-diaminobutyric acid acetyltransferase